MDIWFVDHAPGHPDSPSPTLHRHTPSNSPTPWKPSENEQHVWCWNGMKARSSKLYAGGGKIYRMNKGKAQFCIPFPKIRQKKEVNGN
eukprot:87206-Pelagomonas_calceolata.AAC.1